MHDTAAFLIVEHSQDVDSRSSDSKRTQDKNVFTALVRAAKWGNVELCRRPSGTWRELECTGHEKAYAFVIDIELGKARVLLKHGADVTAKFKRVTGHQ